MSAGDQATAPPGVVEAGPRPVTAGFVTLYALSYAGGALLFLGPLLVSLALKVNDLVGLEAAPRNLALVTGLAPLVLGATQDSWTALFFVAAGCAVAGALAIVPVRRVR